MLGATRTLRGPDVAPVGIVMEIEVPLHELIVTGAPFRITTLFPCELPKFWPVMEIWLPIGPVVADTLVITGAGTVGVLTETLSKVAEYKALGCVLLMPNPM